MPDKLSLFILLVLSVFLSSPACADYIYPYVGVTIGSPLTSVNKLSDSSGSLKTDFNPGYMAGLAAGVSFETTPGWNIEQVRAEVEVGYRSSDLTRMRNTLGQKANMDGTVSVTNFMLNGYLENSSIVSNELKLNLFLTAGVGGAISSISSVTYQGATLVQSASDTQFAYQGGFGTGFALTKNIMLDATYKYMATTTFKFKGVEAEYGSHNILFGARYTFK